MHRLIEQERMMEVQGLRMEELTAELDELRAIEQEVIRQRERERVIL